MPCHCSRHVEYLQEISYRFTQWDAAITSTIYTSVASIKVIKSCFVHSWGCWSRKSCLKILAHTTSWCSISQTVRTNAFIDHGGFLIRAMINWSHISWLAPAVWYIVNWWPLTTGWIYSQPSVYYFWFVLLPVLWTISESASWVIYFVAALGALL
jgi:hypothetical protein